MANPRRVMFKRSPLYAFGVSPNKVFDYMLSGMPIIQSIESPNDLVAEANCGVTIPPEDPHALADAIRRLRAMSCEQRRRLGPNGRHFVTRNHDYRVLARRFLDAVLNDGSTAVSDLQVQP